MLLKIIDRTPYSILTISRKGTKLTIATMDVKQKKYSLFHSKQDGSCFVKVTRAQFNDLIEKKREQFRKSSSLGEKADKLVSQGQFYEAYLEVKKKGKDGV